jgi:hypothetical protein
MANAGRLVICAFSIALLSFATTSLAQDAATGAIRGTVVDAVGSRIGSATVVVVNAATNFRYATTTDISGRFAFELLPPGDYSGRAESPGMSPQTTPRLHVDVGWHRRVGVQTCSCGRKGNGHGFGRAAAGRNPAQWPVLAD